MPVRHIPADEVRATIVKEYRNFETFLESGEEVRLTIFMGTREIPMQLAKIGSTNEGMVVFYGRDRDGKPIDVMLHYTPLAYELSAISAEKPQRIGFHLDASPTPPPSSQ